MKNPNLMQFKKWAKDHKSLAEAVCMAKAFAQIERARVDGYIQPIFESLGLIDEEGNKIEKSRDLYLCTDEAKCNEFYAKSDAAHRAHGFTGPEGHCPALTAETLQLKAENGLLEAGCKMFGVEGAPLYGENRARMLKLLMDSCLGAK